MKLRRLWFYGMILVVIIFCPLIIARLLVKPETDTTQIRYIQPGATEVFLVWGVNGWQLLPNASQPRGTVVRDGVMYTPMTRNEDIFSVAVTLISGTTLNYGFLTTRTANGSIVSSWEANGLEDFKHIVLGDKNIEHVALSFPEDDNPMVASTATSPLDVHIRTAQPQAGEMFLVWGVDGWRILPQPLQPVGTTVINGVMYTPMKPVGLSYAVDLKLPEGATIDYSFLITRKRTGETVSSAPADGENKFHIIINKSETLHHNNSADLSGITEAVRPLSPNWELVTFLGLFAFLGIAGWRLFPDRGPHDWKRSAFFFLTCGIVLALFLSIIRSYLLGFRWIGWLISWAIIPVASVASFYDWGYVTGLTLVFLLILWFIRSQVKAQRILVTIYTLVVVISLSGALFNVQIFSLLEKPLTYQLVNCTDFLGSRDSWNAITNHNLPLSITFVITITLTMLVLAVWLARGISSWRGSTPRTCSVLWSAVIGVLVIYLLFSQNLFAQHLWETARLQNPIVTFTQSTIEFNGCSSKISLTIDK